MFRNIILPQSTPSIPPRIPRHRHGAPSGPWPFIDMDDEVTNNDDSTRIPEQSPSTGPCRHSKRSFQEICWCRYPQSLFPNWTPRQQKKSGITKVIQRPGESSLYYTDIMRDGVFVNAGVRQVSAGTQDFHWAAIQSGGLPGVRTSAIFVENLTGPVLQMLGTRYNIEPFFFSSSIGWIPSRYQSNVVPNRGDHITITLVYIRPIQNPSTVPTSPTSAYAASTASRTAHTPQDQMMDMQAPLPLRSSDLLLLTDLLALHIVRSPDHSTIISYHPTAEHRLTPAASMHSRMQSLGSSVYWSRIFKEERDPTLVVLSLLWYAIYAWDEALERLYVHIGFLEISVLGKNNMSLTQELHLIRAHLLRYESLLRDFRGTVLFIRDTPFPSLHNPEVYTEEERLRSQEVTKREIENLLSEIKRLEGYRKKYESRLKNVMDLGFTMVNVQDSRRMQHLTKSAVRDSAAMKQISYLTMVFFPSSFAATVFGMNVTIINPGGGSLATLGQYFAFVVPLTTLTIWIVVALQINIKQVKVHRTSRRNPTYGNEKNIAIQRHDEGGNLDSNQVGNENEKVDQVEMWYIYNHYGHRNRVLKEGETETVQELSIWARFCWPFILLSIALSEIWRGKKGKARTERAGSNTKTRALP